MFKKSTLLLLLIFLCAVFLRLWMLDSIPNGFHADEAAFGYNAYALLHTGKDEYGKVLPLVLKSFGDYKGAIYAYLTIPSVALFGLTPFAVRLPTALFGILFVWIGFLIARELTKNNTVSLLTALFLTISPISILLSRVQSDPLVAIVFLLVGFYFFLKWLGSNSKLFLIGYAFFFIISFYTYASPRIFIPILFLLLYIFYKSELIKKSMVKSFFIISFIVLLIDGSLFLGHNDQRFNQLTIFNNPAVILPMDEQIREEGHASAFLARVFHNKITAHVSYVLQNYFSYMSYDFLFAQGGLPDRERLADTGLMYPIELPFLLLGIFFSLATKKKWGIFLLSWILLTPFLLAFASDESPNIHRFFFAIWPLEFFTAYGAYELFARWRKQRIVFFTSVIITVSIITFSFLYFCDELFVHQPVHHPWYRGYAYAQLVSSVYAIQNNYQEVVITKALSSPYIYFLFYEKYSPGLYQKEGSPRDLDYTGFGKYLFVPDDCPLRPYIPSQNKIKPERNVLYINKAACPVYTNEKVLKTIYWKDANPAVRLVEYTGENPTKDIQVISR